MSTWAPFPGTPTDPVSQTVWLTQRQMADLFGTTVANVSLHARNAFEEGELTEAATVKESLMVRTEGQRQVRRRVRRYNLDVVISVGYRVRQVPLRRCQALSAPASDLRGLPGGHSRRTSAVQEAKDSRAKGHSYPQGWYEDAIGGLLGELGSVDDQAMSEVVRLYGEDAERPDELTLARIEREREEASQRLAKTRDIAAWQATMSRLDAEAQVARQPRHQQRLEPAEVVEYLRSLPTLWADAGPEGRQAVASALFSKLEVEGYVKMTYELTPDAVELGLDMALPATFTLEEGGFGRGERDSESLTHLRFRPRFVLENATESRRMWPVDVLKAG